MEAYIGIIVYRFFVDYIISAHVILLVNQKHLFETSRAIAVESSKKWGPRVGTAGHNGERICSG